jgi:LysR family glycine cleavage system transcriptional activator
MNRLPPLRLLVTFEAVSRLGSMREAANELNVTQPAVTQALRALEDHIGTTLLDRSRKPARLTASGHILARATSDGLDTILNAIDDINEDELAQDLRLTVSCTLGMATYWLMPRLSKFYKKHPDVLINVQAPPTNLPMMSSSVDMVLWYGKGGWSDEKTIKLFDERVCPVGSPTFIEHLQRENKDLNAAQHINVRSPNTRYWVEWPDYLKRIGLTKPHGHGPTFDNYVQAAQAALDGRGLLLGWRSITETMVAEGRLVEWPNGAIDFGTSYFVTLSEKAQSKSSAAAFLSWLTEEAGA